MCDRHEECKKKTFVQVAIGFKIDTTLIEHLMGSEWQTNVEIIVIETANLFTLNNTFETFESSLNITFVCE